MLAGSTKWGGLERGRCLTDVQARKMTIWIGGQVDFHINFIKKKLNMWLTAPKGATPVNQTSATD